MKTRTKFEPRMDYGQFCKNCGKEEGMHHTSGQCATVKFPDPAEYGITAYLRTVGTPRSKPHVFYDRNSHRWTAYVSPSTHPQINLQAINFCERLQHGRQN